MNEVMAFLMIAPLILAMWALVGSLFYCIYKDFNDR